MNTHTAKIATLAIVILWNSAQAKDEEKLLPSEEAAKISMTWRLDGRSLLVNIKNDSRLSLISAELDCKVYDTSKPIPKFAPNGDEVCVSGPNLEDLFQKQRLRQLGKECVYKYPFSHTIPEPVLSGKSKEFYFETAKFRMPPIQCELTDLRGRARKLWEF